jgi:hypothetical protein
MADGEKLPGESFFGLAIPTEETSDEEKYLINNFLGRRSGHLRHGYVATGSGG